MALACGLCTIVYGSMIYYEVWSFVFRLFESVVGH